MLSGALFQSALGLGHLLCGRGLARLHHVDEAVEEVGGIVGAWTCFGVILDGKDRLKENDLSTS
jgi:hypothetical protein